jgi:hypothetical protein
MSDSKHQTTRGDQHDHDKYLLQPSAEKLRAKLKVFGVDESSVYPMPFICNLRQLTVVLTPMTKFDPSIGEIERFVHYLKPQSLHELKALVGIPNQVMKNDTSCGKRREVCMHHLPAQKSFSFQHLEPEQRSAVRDTAHNLLYGYVDEERARRQPLNAVVEYMLQASQNVPVFVAKDLVVCPGHKVEFKNFGALYFNNVLVYGTGQIKLGNHTKLHAQQVIHVPA